MAKEPAKTDKPSKDTPPAEGEEAAVKPKKKGRLLLLVVLLVLLAGGGGAAWYFLGQSSPEDVPVEADQPEPKHEAPPIFATLEQFTVNLLGDNGSHYLQIGIGLKVADEKVPEAIKLHMPEIRNSVLLLLSSKHSDELMSIDGKNKLRSEIRSQINKHLGIDPPLAEPAAQPEGGSAPQEAPTQADADEPAAEQAQGVIDVLLTSFVIQ